ncbi:MAG: bifunctional methylenetetrahydrofolate dehydrogenase/methenyltetrahydrofolate cyclohydrolase FolD [Gammaproteobacteria bacterium]|nr:bifunctional methylenetetrahydrofolate dehydrogenase/methenyltetrahydrofolate cyclohydrolase FolD [Gammaproteobacteria bacterium]
MTAQILDGKKLAAQIREGLRQKLAAQRSDVLRAPALTVILVGDHPASQIYVSHKIKACEEVGIHSEYLHFPASMSEAELLGTIMSLNQNHHIDGILVQLPLPAHIHNEKILLALDPLKDVDGFHPENIGLLAVRASRLSPATPRGIMQLLEHSVGDLKGMHAVIVGASNIVGRPTALELLNRRVTVTICHSQTRDLINLTRQADLLISATGMHGLITAEHIKPAAIVVDVGIHRLASGQLVGDVLFDDVAEKASWITPVPGGVGPMTIVGLLQNTIEAYQLNLGK